MDTIVNNLIDQFDSNTAIFFGAGVSLNSGIPIVYGFNEDDGSYHEGIVDNIINRTKVDAIEGKILKESNLPFEGFIKALTYFSEISTLLDIFNLGTENHFHDFMAFLYNSTIKFFLRLFLLPLNQHKPCRIKKVLPLVSPDFARSYVYRKGQAEKTL